jgi:hypothetical protein
MSRVTPILWGCWVPRRRPTLLVVVTQMVGRCGELSPKDIHSGCLLLGPLWEESLNTVALDSQRFTS